MTGVWLENGGSVGLNLVLVNGLAWAEMHMHLTALEVGEWGGGGIFKIQISCHNTYILVLFRGSTTTKC